MMMIKTEAIVVDYGEYMSSCEKEACWQWNKRLIHRAAGRIDCDRIEARIDGRGKDIFDLVRLIVLLVDCLHRLMDRKGD